MSVRVATRRERMLRGIAAMRDVTRALRGTGSVRGASAPGMDRSALLDLASMADRLDGFAEDQGADDWGEFWITSHDVETVRAHLDAIGPQLRGTSPESLPALHVLMNDLATFVATDA